MAVVGEEINDLVIIRDNANVAITGLTTASFATLESYAVANPGTTAPVSVTEIGGGEYDVAFTPTTPTVGADVEWILHVVYDVSGVFREFSETYDVALSAQTVDIVYVAASGGLITTLGELRRRVADRFEDLVMGTATSNGNVGMTTIVDSYHVNQGTEHFNGRDVVMTSGSNAGLHRRVETTGSTTGTLTLNQALTVQTITNDTYEIYNRRGRGFAVEQYDRAINNAIDDAYPTGTISIVATITLPFDVLNPEITLPESVIEVNALEAEDSNGIWHEIPQARARGGAGWFADAALGQLRLHGTNAWAVNASSLRVFGQGRQGRLSADTDTCALSPKFIVAHAAYHLALSGVGNEENSVRVNLFRDEMERFRTTLRRFPGPIRKRVTAA